MRELKDKRSLTDNFQDSIYIYIYARVMDK